MGHVYGDSTPFPYDVNFIEQIRRLVECGVELMRAQHAVGEARQAAVGVEALRKAERARLTAMSDAVKLTMTAFSSALSERIARAANRILDSSRSIIEGEMAALDGQVVDTQAGGRGAIESARDTVCRAVESFVLNHDLPNTEVSVRLLAEESTYSGEAVVETPFGVEAIFALAIPGAHAWGKPRRVLELSASTEVHLPAETGIFSKKTKLVPVKLDKLFIAEVARSEARTLITLRKGPRSGTGYELEVIPDEQRVLLRRLDEDGQPETSSEIIALTGEDLIHAQRLWNRIVETTADLQERRQAMTSATFDGKPLRDLDEPQDLLTRLINVVAPVVQEIARRSGAPGELVLRRDMGEGRREEIYITKAELHEKVMSLPPSCRPIFDPLELSEGPRSPRAPAPSEPIYLESDATNPGIPMPTMRDLDDEVTRTKSAPDEVTRAPKSSLHSETTGPKVPK
jgi:hypothetical protein